MSSSVKSSRSQNTTGTGILQVHPKVKILKFGMNYQLHLNIELKVACLGLSTFLNKLRMKQAQTSNTYVQESYE